MLSNLTLKNDRETLEFSVIAFSFVSALSYPYCLNLWVIHPRASLNFAEIWACAAAHFSYETEAGIFHVSGLVTHLAQRANQAWQENFKASEGALPPFQWRLEIRPLMALLSQSRTVMVFQHRSVEEILQSFLGQIKEKMPGLDAQLDLRGGYLKTPLPQMELSFGNSDLEYLHHLSAYGFFYYFEHHPHGSAWKISDLASALPVLAEPLLGEPFPKNARWHDSLKVKIMKSSHHTLPLRGRGRCYHPDQAELSLQRLTQTLPDNIFEIDRLFHPEEQEAIDQRLTEALNFDAQQLVILGNTARLSVGMQLVFDGKSYWVYKQHLEGRYELGHFQIRTSVVLLPEAASRLGVHGRLIKKSLPGFLHGNTLSSDRQVNEAGYFRVQLSAALVSAQRDPPEVLFRDLQGTSTAGGGASHCTSDSAELLLASANGFAGDWVIAGSFHQGKTPSDIAYGNEQYSLIENKSGVNLRMARQDWNPEGGHLHLGVKHVKFCDAKETFIRLGSFENEAGLQECSVAFAHKAVAQEWRLQLAKDPEAAPVYRFQYQQDPEVLTETIQVDTYSLRHYGVGVSIEKPS